MTTTTEKVVGGIIVLGAIGGLVYVLKKNVEKKALAEVEGGKVVIIDEPTEAQKETIVAVKEAIKEQKSMFAEKAIAPLVLSSYIPSTNKNNSFIKPFKPMVFEPIGGRPETPSFTGVPSGGFDLGKGSKGKNVEILQKNLGFVTREFAKTARFAPPGPNIIDGDFGQKTETALFKKYGVKSIRLSQLK